MDDISYAILSHGHYFIEDNILWFICTSLDEYATSLAVYVPL
jgi:hypothetical protein